MLFMLKMMSCTTSINGSAYIAIQISVLDLGSTGIATATIATYYLYTSYSWVIACKLDYEILISP